MIELLTKDQIKVLYRGNLTINQAALYMAKSVAWVKAQIAMGKLGTNLDGSHISKIECDRFLKEDTRYLIPISERKS